MIGLEQKLQRYCLFILKQGWYYLSILHLKFFNCVILTKLQLLQFQGYHLFLNFKINLHSKSLILRREFKE